MRERYDVWAIVMDPGGMVGILPVVDELEKTGASVLLIANGYAADFLKDVRSHIVVSCPEELAEYTFPKVLITDLSTGGGVGRDIIPLIREKSIVVAGQSYWGAHLLDSWRDQRFRPDYIWVNDSVDQEIVLRAWGDFEIEKILVTGYPAFDRYAGLDIQKIRAHTRHTLGLEDDLPVVLYAGGGNASAATLGEVVDVLNDLATDCYLLPRVHPRAKQDFASELVQWQRSLARSRSRIVMDWFNQCGPMELMSLCTANRGVVVSMFSTMLAEAACLRVPTLAVLYPELGWREFCTSVALAESNMNIRLGCAEVARSREEVHRSLSLALRQQFSRIECQNTYFHIDGQNTRRVVEALLCWI